MPRHLSLCVAVALATSVAAASVSAQKFLPDDPIQRDRDDLPIALPGEVELSTAWDVIENSFGQPRPRQGEPIPVAQNVNTLGEVPDSSWFTNRIGVRPMSEEGILRGSNNGSGPNPSEWIVVRGKSGGITPGFTIRDTRGDVYFLKVDPETHFGLSTGAELIGSRLFHAFGYFVPESWIVYQERSRIRVGEGATLRQRGGKPRPMRAEDVDAMLGRAARLPDGRVRFVASKAVPGKAIGPHEYYGTRGDDPNDVIPHEHRRELRGYRVFCAWLNHDDSRAANSLNTWIETGDGKGHVVHYLQDFSSMLGSGSNYRREIAPQNPRAGNEYILELAPLLKTALSLGIWQRPWHAFEYTVYPQVGAIEAEGFDPDGWRPEYPNAAFERMLPEDAFWAARIVSKLPDTAIRRIVAEADLRAPEAEAHLVKMILARRDKVLARYFSVLNPLAEFRIETTASGPSLLFTHHGEDAGLAAVDGYEVQWFAFDNLTLAETPLGVAARLAGRALPLPVERPEYLKARIRGTGEGPAAWRDPVDVFIRTAPVLEVVGIERHPAPASVASPQSR
jgi:hypothetical protein